VEESFETVWTMQLRSMIVPVKRIDRMVVERQ